MNQIQNPANDNYNSGLEFNYAVWTANTDITLTNVPWDNNYRDIVSFTSTDALNAYIDARASDNTRISNTLYAKADEPIILDIPFNSALRFNYVRVYNPAQPIDPTVGGADTPKYFYYFVINARYIAPNTTEIQVQLDVVQTYMRSMQLGRCYIERGHLGIANEDNFQNYGKDYLTVPEGIDTGSDYLTVMQRGDTQVMLPFGGRSSILVASSIKLEQPPGTKEKPSLDSAEGGLFQGLPSGASYYLFTSANEFLTFMRSYSKYPWITQGITSITIIPNYSRYFTLAQLGPKLSIGAYKAPGLAAQQKRSNLQNNWRSDNTLRNYIPPRYRHLKKFYTFPYMALELTTMNGQSSILKPEQWHSANAEIIEEASLVPPSQRIQWYPSSYKSQSEPVPNGQITGVGTDHAASVANFPALALVNNGAILAMANSAHAIAFGYQSADWSQQRALRANEVGYDQATAGMNTASDIAGIGMNADSASTGIANQLAQDSAMLNAIGGTASGAGMGAFAGPAGAIAGGIGGAASGVMGLLNTGNQVNASNAQLANRLSAASGTTNAQTGLSTNLRDSNKSLSDFAARGDYENTIAGLNARTRDMQLTPPSASGQMGGEMLGILNFRFGYVVRWLMPDQASLNTVGEYWLRYGYAIQRFAFVPNDLMVMTKFTYWKMKETNIRSANVPEAFKQAWRGILEKGVTVWRDPDDIGFVDTADNEPIPGIVIDGYVPPVPEPEDPPEPPDPVIRRKRKKMVVYGTVSTVPGFEGNTYALAGTSPGTQANWIETQDPVRYAAFLDATGQEAAVGLPEADYYILKAQYLAPVNTAVEGGEVTP